MSKYKLSEKEQNAIDTSAYNTQRDRGLIPCAHCGQMTRTNKVVNCIPCANKLFR